MRIFRITLAATGLAATLALSACGADSTSSTASSNGATSSGSSSASADRHNPADVTFAQSMIPHHQQAIAMADLASARASNAQVKELAAKIKAAQGPEIETMTGWLKTWGEPTAMPTMGHDMGSMPGMMSDQDMNQLMGMSGHDFDRQFLTMMIRHHRGAVQMAQTEQSDDDNADAKALSAKIVADQTAEITQMQDLLPQL